MVPYDKRMEDIKNLTQCYANVNEFYKCHPYLYRWALKHDVDVKKYFPKKSIRCNIDDRENKGIDCYNARTRKFHKHYPFVRDALRDLDLTYYYVNRVLNGEIDEINGYFFVRCE